jgi:hypothetical protein
MTTYAWPSTGAAFGVAGMSLGFVQNQRISTSTLNGATQSVSLPGARLRALISFPAHPYATRAQLEGFLNRLSGMEHRVSLHDFARPVPRGTCNLSGVTVQSLASQFATTLVLAGCGASATLLVGDWIKVTTSTGAQVVQIAADATADGSGVMTVEVRAMLRGSVSAASGVTLSKPTALYVLREDDGLMMPRGLGQVAPEITVQFVEVFS